MNNNDFKTLFIIEKLMHNYGFVPLEVIENKSSINQNQVKKSIEKLLDLGLIISETSPFYGYQLTFNGLDILALRFYFNKKIIIDIGDKINSGKESDIYNAKLISEKDAIIKFHKEGRTSFKAIKRKRSFEFKKWNSWIELSKKIANREFSILTNLWKRGALVPEPIYNNRHSIIMEKIDGVELYKIKELSEEMLKNIINDVIVTLKIAYKEIGIIHGDLSPYNILVSNGQNSRGYIIDWPQFIDAKDKNADLILKKELEYLASYFYKRFEIEVSVEELINSIKGGN